MQIVVFDETIIAFCGCAVGMVEVVLVSLLVAFYWEELSLEHWVVYMRPRYVCNSLTLLLCTRVVIYLVNTDRN